MKRTILIGAMILGFVFVANIVFGDFYVIPTHPRIAGTEITSLPYTITSSGFYFITKDLTSTGDGITVNADNVTIDMMGFSLIGPGKSSGIGHGIFMSGRANVEVRNGTVRDFGDDGIQENSTGMNHRIIGVRVNGNAGVGMWICGKNHLIKNCTASNNGEHGIYAYYGCNVTGNTAYNNISDGINTKDCCNVIGNTAYDNDGDGIQTGTGCTVKDNTADYNQNVGIQISAGSTVTGNTTYNNQGGIATGGGCMVTGNSAFSNSSNGISAGAGSTVRGNSSRYNGGYGIYLSGDCLVHANTATGNTNNIYCNGTCNSVDNYAS